MPDESRRKPFKKPQKSTGPLRRRRRPVSGDPNARPPGFPLPYVQPEPTEESTDVAGE